MPTLRFRRYSQFSPLFLIAIFASLSTGFSGEKERFFPDEAFGVEADKNLLQHFSKELLEAGSGGVSKSIGVEKFSPDIERSPENEEKLRLARLRAYILWRHFEIPQDAVDEVFMRYLNDKKNIRNRKQLFIHDLTKPRDIPRFYAIDMQFDPLKNGIDMTDPEFQQKLLNGKPRTSELMDALITPVRSHKSWHGYGSVDDSDERYAIHFGDGGGSGKNALGAMVTGEAGEFNTQPGRPKILLRGLDDSNENALTRKIYLHPATDAKGVGWTVEQLRMEGNSAGCVVLALKEYNIFAAELAGNEGALLFNWYDRVEQDRFRKFEADQKTSPGKYTLTDYYRARRNFKLMSNGQANITAPDWLKGLI